jgi:hypothetical protein
MVAATDSWRREELFRAAKIKVDSLDGFYRTKRILDGKGL